MRSSSHSWSLLLTCNLTALGACTDVVHSQLAEAAEAVRCGLWRRFSLGDAQPRTFWLWLSGVAKPFALNRKSPPGLSEVAQALTSSAMEDLRKEIEALQVTELFIYIYLQFLQCRLPPSSSTEDRNTDSNTRRPSSPPRRRRWRSRAAASPSSCRTPNRSAAQLSRTCTSPRARGCHWCVHTRRVPLRSSVAPVAARGDQTVHVGGSCPETHLQTHSEPRRRRLARLSASVGG